jgi:hypothetical protein
VFSVDLTVLRLKSNESLPQCSLFAMGFVEKLLQVVNPLLFTLAISSL